MALHKVFLYQNTSVLPDELLVHRIGLLPLVVEAKHFEYRKDSDEFTVENSLKFELKVVCKRKKEYENLSEDQL
jgi:DNA-directed RNA polymerase I and III subunit RPAC1